MGLSLQMKPFCGHVLAIGAELLHGGRVDSNSLFIADRLAYCGIRITKKIVVGDDLAAIQRALRYLVQTSGCRHRDRRTRVHGR